MRSSHWLGGLLAAGKGWALGEAFSAVACQELPRKARVAQCSRYFRCHLLENFCIELTVADDGRLDCWVLDLGEQLNPTSSLFSCRVCKTRFSCLFLQQYKDRGLRSLAWNTKATCNFLISVLVTWASVVQTHVCQGSLVTPQILLGLPP
jgi:hypothetical protein